MNILTAGVIIGLFAACAEMDTAFLQIIWSGFFIGLAGTCGYLHAREFEKEEE